MKASCNVLSIINCDKQNSYITYENKNNTYRIYSSDMLGMSAIMW